MSNAPVAYKPLIPGSPSHCREESDFLSVNDMAVLDSHLSNCSWL